MQLEKTQLFLSCINLRVTFTHSARKEETSFCQSNSVKKTYIECTFSIKLIYFIFQNVYAEAHKRFLLSCLQN